MRCGFRVKEVKSLADISGKTGFIVLGWFPIKINYFMFYEYEYIDFHIIRVNPDGTIFNKENFTSPARDLKSLDDPELYDYHEELRDGDYRVFVLEE